MIYVVATTHMKPEGREAFIKGHKAAIAETLKEKGCLSYEGHTSVNDPNVYVVVERWENREDLNAHGRAPHMKAFGRIAAQCLAAPPRIEVITPEKVDVR